jgi:hypothetical protein
MKLPENGASMHDAANTREDERPSFCEPCIFDPNNCGYTESECIRIEQEGIADDKVKAAKEDRDDN